MSVSEDFFQYCANHLGSVICNTSGPKLHPGIICGVETRFNPISYQFERFVIVAHNHPDLGGAGVSYFEAYWNDIRWEAVFETGSQQSLVILQNVDAIIERKIAYHAMNWNCQHFVTAALGLQPKSVQIEGVKTLVVATGVGAVVLKILSSLDFGRRR